MVKPSKESAAAGGRAKVVAQQSNAFRVQPKSVVTRIPLPNGERIVFPDNWHEHNKHPRKTKRPGALSSDQRRHG